MRVAEGDGDCVVQWSDLHRIIDTHKKLIASMQTLASSSAYSSTPSRTSESFFVVFRSSSHLGSKDDRWQDILSRSSPALCVTRSAET